MKPEHMHQRIKHWSPLDNCKNCPLTLMTCAAWDLSLNIYKRKQAAKSKPWDPDQNHTVTEVPVDNVCQITPLQENTHAQLLCLFGASMLHDTGAFEVAAVDQVEHCGRIWTPGHHVLFSPPGQMGTIIGEVMDIMLVLPPDGSRMKCVLELGIYGKLVPAGSTAVCATTSGTILFTDYLIDVSVAKPVRVVPPFRSSGPQTSWVLPMHH